MAAQRLILSKYIKISPKVKHAAMVAQHTARVLKNTVTVPQNTATVPRNDVTAIFFYILSFDAMVSGLMAVR
jgi:hypothetical protein